MDRTRQSWAFGLLLVLTFVAPSRAEAAKVEGVVRSVSGAALKGATVRWQARDKAMARTDDNGKFSLTLDGKPDRGTGYTVTAAKAGYYNTGIVAADGAKLTITLSALGPDNPSYRWVPPEPDSKLSPFTPALGCGNCHADYYDTWKKSRHSLAATDPLVLDLYTGSGKEGKEQKLGPGWLVDNPGKPGPCANCHAPTASLAAPDQTRLDQLEPIHKNGVFCETCHKVSGLGDDPSKTPVTGAFSFWRPEDNVLMAFGPLDDANDRHHMGPMSYAPYMKQARFCAGCHQWKNAQGVMVMETFSEWAASVYAKDTPCQNCHMRRFDEESVKPLAPAKFKAGDQICLVRNPQKQRQAPEATCDRMGAVRRNQKTIFPHIFKGGDDDHYLKNAAKVTVSAKRNEQDDGLVDVEVKVENVNAGHKLPTGMPFREVLLVLRALDGSGAALELREGSKLPESADKDNKGQALAGAAGRNFSKVLADAKGKRNPMFWAASAIAEDTRIPAGATDVSFYRFAAPPDVELTIKAELLYRRVRHDLAQKKGWSIPDKLMTSATKSLPAGSPSGCAVGSDPEAGAGLIVALMALALLLGARRRRLWLLALAAIGLGACFDLKPIEQARVDQAEVKPLSFGAPCQGDEACASGRCAPACDGDAYCAAKTSCERDSDCGGPGAKATFCCVEKKCVVAPGGKCGTAKGKGGSSCAAGGQSDCASGLTCVNRCTPAAVCAKPCKSDKVCQGEIDQATGKPKQYCAPVNAGAGFCFDDPEVTLRCTVDADCAKLNKDAICDIRLARDGDTIATVCRGAPVGPGPVGYRCAANMGPSASMCRIGICWTNPGFRQLCSATCDPKNGDADCKCAPGDRLCKDQICLKVVYSLSRTDPKKLATVPLCYDAQRCQGDDGCPADRYCSAADQQVEIQTICKPRLGKGKGNYSACTSSAQCASRNCDNNVCRDRKALGEKCAKDAECWDRCVDGLCSGPCKDAAYCQGKSAAFKRCESKDLPYGMSTKTQAIKVCLP